jgi:hypothetical protein
MTFATNETLQQYVTDIFDHGIDDWSDEIALAESDVIDQVRIRYWNKFHSAPNFDQSKLTATQWTKATVYRALATYIGPKLSTFRVDDVFLEQIKFYKERYAEELDTQFALGIEYDTNGDSTVSNGEITTFVQDRLYR